MEENEVQSGAMVKMIADSELDKQITTALAHPRRMSHVIDEATSLATLTQDVAEDCMYALPRKQKDPETGRMVTKNIEGPTVRFAEILAYSWGNMRIGARVVDESGDYVTAQGIAFDLQKNISITMEVRRKITGRDGNRFSADMVAVTGQAAAAIARRNAILAVIPKPFWKAPYESAVKVIRGDASTLIARRDKVLQRFQRMSVTPEMICRLLGIDSVFDISLEDLGTLIGIGTAIKDGTTTVEEAFRDPNEPEASERSPLSDRIREVKAAEAPAEAAPAVIDPAIVAEAEAPAVIEAERARVQPTQILTQPASIPEETARAVVDAEHGSLVTPNADEPTVEGFCAAIAKAATEHEVLDICKPMRQLFNKEEIVVINKAVARRVSELNTARNKQT